MLLLLLFPVNVDVIHLDILDTFHHCIIHIRTDRGPEPFLIIELLTQKKGDCDIIVRNKVKIKLKFTSITYDTS